MFNFPDLTYCVVFSSLMDSDCYRMKCYDHKELYSATAKGVGRGA